MNNVTSAYHAIGANFLFTLATFLATHNLGIAALVGMGVFLSFSAIGLAIEESLKVRA